MNENISLVNEYCDLVNKLIYFIQNYFEGIVPAGHLDEELYWKTKDLYEQEQDYLQEGRQEELLDLVYGYLHFANDYFEQGKPWENSIKNRRACRNTILNSVQLVANLTVLLSPVASHPADQVSRLLDLEDKWEVQKVHSGYELPETGKLFGENFYSEKILSENAQIGA